MNIININDRKNKVKLALPIPSYKVKINYSNVKYLEEAPAGRTKVHFNDGTYLLINRTIESAGKEMDRTLQRQR